MNNEPIIMPEILYVHTSYELFRAAAITASRLIALCYRSVEKWKNDKTYILHLYGSLRDLLDSCYGICVRLLFVCCISVGDADEIKNDPRRHSLQHLQSQWGLKAASDDDPVFFMVSFLHTETPSCRRNSYPSPWFGDSTELNHILQNIAVQTVLFMDCAAKL